jgi:hypothetical protein
MATTGGGRGYAFRVVAGFFSQGDVRLLGAAGLLVVIGLLVYDGVRENRLGIGSYFVHSGGVMLLTVGGLSAYGYAGTPIALPDPWTLGGWIGVVLSVGGFALWLTGLTYNSTQTGTDFSKV